MWPTSIRFPALCLFSLLVCGPVKAQDFDFSVPIREPDVAYVPTPPEVVRAMLELANVGRGDIVYDLGSGDGRIVIAAVRDFGARGVGIDVNPRRIHEARMNARKDKLGDRIKFIQGDMFVEDISEATVVTLYLLRELNLRLRPKLLSELAPGTRIVSQTFNMGDWKPDKTILVHGKKVFYWVVP